MKRLWLFVFPLICTWILGCAVPERLLKPKVVNGTELLPPYQTETHKVDVHLFDAIDLRPDVSHEQWQMAVDHLIVIWDQAGLTANDRRADEARSTLIDSREWLRRFNFTLPLTDFPGLLISTSLGKRNLSGVNGTERYLPLGIEKEMEQAIHIYPAGNGRLDLAIAQATDAAVKLPGRSALVVITDWDRIGTAELNALDRYHQRLRHRAGQSVSINTRPWNGKQNVGACVHLVGIGNAFSRERMLRVPNCTSANTFGGSAQPRDMARFVSTLLYAGPADDDGDGIPNYLDECPNTPTGRLVTSKGCLRFPTESEAVAEMKPLLPTNSSIRSQ